MIRVTLDVTSASEEVLEQYCSDFLKGRGWQVTSPNEKWETLCGFIKRVGCSSYSQFYRQLVRWKQRGNDLPILRTREGRGRISRLCSNAEFDAFCAE